VPQIDGDFWHSFLVRMRKQGKDPEFTGRRIRLVGSPDQLQAHLAGERLAREL